jgi:hypothetical protein
MKCDLCDAEASVSATDCFLDDDHHISQNLCIGCANQRGMNIDTSIAEKVQKIRNLVEFIHANNRMPSPNELRLLGGAGNMSSTAPGTKEYLEQVHYLEMSLDFIEQHKRWPTEQELPDPF